MTPYEILDEAFHAMGYGCLPVAVKDGITTVRAVIKNDDPFVKYIDWDFVAEFVCDPEEMNPEKMVRTIFVNGPHGDDTDKIIEKYCELIKQTKGDIQCRLEKIGS